MSDLETRNIFLDTSIFIKNKFQFHNYRFQRLIQLRRTRSIRLYTTDITNDEIRFKINESVEKSIQAARTFRSNATILSNIGDPPFNQTFIRLDKNDIQKKINQIYESFLEESKTSQLSTDSVSIKRVFHKYFNSIAPFGIGEKKSEFPDAFVIESISDWCKKQNNKIYLISGDNDFLEACKGSDNLLYLEKIEEFINLIIKHDEEYGEKAVKLVEGIRDDLAVEIENKFEYLGFFLEDQDGEVIDVNVLNVEFRNIYFINYDNDTGYFELETIVNFTAEVIYDDLETAHYDSEDKQLYPWRKIQKQLDKYEELMVNVRADFNVPVSEIKYFQILDINGGQDISLRVEEYDHF